MNCLPSGKIELLKKKNCDRASEYVSSRRSSYFLEKKVIPGVINLVNIYWGILIFPKISTGEYFFRGVHFYGDTGNKKTVSPVFGLQNN